MGRAKLYILYELHRLCKSSFYLHCQVRRRPILKKVYNFKKTRCEVPLRRVREQQEKNKMPLIPRTSLTVDPVREVFFLIAIRPVRYISRE